MNPPLGTEADRQALLAGLAAGTIDAIGTDHAPHAAWEKAEDFVSAPFGVLGLETALPACLSMLCDAGIIDLPKLVHLMTYGPARVLGLDAGTLAQGAVADVTVFDHQRFEVAQQPVPWLPAAGRRERDHVCGRLGIPGDEWMMDRRRLRLRRLKRRILRSTLGVLPLHSDHLFLLFPSVVCRSVAGPRLFP